MNNNLQLNTTQIQSIAIQISKIEPTIELQNYWSNRYQELLESKFFVISTKTTNIIIKNQKIINPVTPFGYIVIDKFLIPSGSIDEILLQNTLETAIRFLDACLDVIDFEPEVKKIVNGYRKIGVDIEGFEDYMLDSFAKTGNNNELEQIDYIGNLVSNVCYRVSESLAEEKGTCANWDRINKIVKAKPFEYWFNESTGEIKNSLELMEIINVDSVDESGWEIYPRRNSHILIYPKTPEWKIWSDRDETIVTKVQPNIEEVPVVQSPDTIIETSKITNDTLESIKQIKDDKITIVKDIEDSEINSAENNQNTKNSNNFGLGFDPVTILNQVIDKVYTKDKQKLEEKEKSEKHDINKSKIKSKFEFLPINNVDGEHAGSENLDNDQIQFDVGDAVKVINPTFDSFGKVYTIQKILREDNESLVYTLNRNDEIMTASDIEFSTLTFAKSCEEQDSNIKTNTNYNSQSNYNIVLKIVLISPDLKKIYLTKDKQIVNYSQSQDKVTEQDFVDYVNKNYDQKISNLRLIANQYNPREINSLYYSICTEVSKDLIEVNVVELEGSTRSMANLVINEVLLLQNSARSQANTILESVLSVEMQAQKMDLEQKLNKDCNLRIQEIEKNYQELIKTKFVAKDIVDAKIKQLIEQNSNSQYQKSFSGSVQLSGNSALDLTSKNSTQDNQTNNSDLSISESNNNQSAISSPNNSQSYMSKLKKIQKFASTK